MNATGSAVAAPGSERAGVTVVVPVLDEERAVVSTLRAIATALQGQPRAWEIVVVDDGSRDSTPQQLATVDGIRVIRHDENRGYGAALKAGVAAARHPLVAVIDADGTYPVSALPRLLESIDGADMVVAARVGRSQPAPLRNGVKWIFRQYAQWLTGAAIPDLNSGLRVLRGSLVERFSDVLPDGFSFTTTITVASMLSGLVVRFEPIDYLPRIGRSKIHPVRDTLRIARQLLRLGARFAPLRASIAWAALFALAMLASSTWHVAVLGALPPFDLAWLVPIAAALCLGAHAQRKLRLRREAVAGRSMQTEGS